MWRVVVPGVLTVIGALSLIVPGGDFIAAFKGLDIKEIGPAGILVIAIGIVYRLADTRERLSIQFSWSDLHEDIRASLLAAVRERRGLSEAEEQFLRDERRLLDIFYGLVDSDESLKNRAESIRLNGLIVTSLADLAIIGILASLLHFLVVIAGGPTTHAYWYFGACMTWTLSEAVLLPSALRKHRRLSGEQITFIANNRADELGARVENTLQRMRAIANAQSFSGATEGHP